MQIKAAQFDALYPLKCKGNLYEKGLNEENEILCKGLTTNTIKLSNDNEVCEAKWLEKAFGG